MNAAFDDILIAASLIASQAHLGGARSRRCKIGCNALRVTYVRVAQQA